MKILLLLSESWNDKAVPNNNMTNWFYDFPGVEIWTVSGSSLLPDNQCCNHYFLISENDMLRSMFSKAKAGKQYYIDQFGVSDKDEISKEIDISNNKKIKQLLAGETARLARDIVWRFGHYDLDALRQFVKEFNPDIVFSQRRGSIKMCRLENIISEITDAPIVAYTGDDEYSLHQFSLSPFFWVRRFWTRAWLKRTIPKYELLYSQSERQMREFEGTFNVDTKFLVKCGKFDERKIHKNVSNPIQIVYAGKLYCNRWKTLGLIADAIRLVNKKEGLIKLQLNIYTADSITQRQNSWLNDGLHSIIHGRVPTTELPIIYEGSDIVLHVESFDLKNRLCTQDSFSTKVMDCLSSGCTVMAVCWERHAAYQYLKKMDAAIVASSSDEIYEQIEKIASNQEILCEYAKKAFQCGKHHHQRKQIQKMIYEDFGKVISG